jgi:cysteine-rich repeat protein
MLTLTPTNQSLCFASDDDDDQSGPVAYSPGSPACNETGVVDINVFAVDAHASGNGSPAVAFDVDAGVVADANPASTEYQAGRIAYDFTLEISGTGGADWDLVIDQQLQGLLTTVSDGDGSANAGATGAALTLDGGPPLDFAAPVSRSAGGTGSQPFSASRIGDVVSGSGDTTLSGSLEITIDAYSDCGGLLCLGNADEGAVLFGLDDVSSSIFVSADEYSTWGRAVGPDGYRVTFTLDAGPFCGDGTTDGGRGEECDDGNMASGDGCSDLCVVEFCGDGALQPGLGEECDDGNTTGGDGCSDVCAVELTVPALADPGAWLLALALAVAGARGLRRPERRPNDPSGSPGRRGPCPSSARRADPARAPRRCCGGSRRSPPPVGARVRPDS